jgi:hypothetical protein
MGQHCYGRCVCHWHRLVTLHSCAGLPASIMTTPIAVQEREHALSQSFQRSAPLSHI